jgi:hypothetical protein
MSGDVAIDLHRSSPDVLWCPAAPLVAGSRSLSLPK